LDFHENSQFKPFIKLMGSDRFITYNLLINQKRGDTMAKRKAKSTKTVAAKPLTTTQIKHHHMTPLGWLAFILVVVGGLNWGLVGIGMLSGRNMNVLNLIFGSIPALEAIIYIIVGLLALYGIFRIVQIH
jgi:uncharacterized membrane protein YuzA (DUF378 family)